MENKQTAVEWLLQQMNTLEWMSITRFDIIKQAKQMEKEQIIDARVSGFASSAEGWNGEYPSMKWSEMVRETKCEEYYNKTYGKENSN